MPTQPKQNLLLRSPCMKEEERVPWGKACHSPRLPWNDCKIHGMKMMISTYIIHSIHRIRHTGAIFYELTQSALNYII